jgi:integral membrane protein
MAAERREHGTERTDPSRAGARGSEQAVGAALQRYRFTATVVGVLLIALIVVAVPLKYLADMPGPVEVLGTAHGWLYFLFFLSAIDLALRARWTLKGTVLTVVAGTVPFLSFYAERSATRKTRAGEPV